MYFSEFTIRNDLKRIAAMVSAYDDLKLQEDGNRVSLLGSEQNKRRLYKDLLIEETNGNFININKIAEFFPEFDLLKVKETLEDVFKKYNYKIRPETYPMLILHIGVSIQRMISDNFADVAVEQGMDIKNSKEYEITKDFLDECQKFIVFEVGENETILLARLLMGKKRRMYDDESSISLDAEILTNQILKSIKNQYDIDFASDEFFKEGLILHLQNLFSRLHNDTYISNVYLPDIKRSYPLIFDMAVFVGKCIEAYTNARLVEDELGFLAVHIGAAYDRLNVKHYFHAILIYPNNVSFDNLCQNKIMDKFGDKIMIDTVLSWYEEETIKAYNPDFIISTVYIKHSLDIPTVTIGMFLNDNDEFRIYRMINELERKHHKLEFSKEIKNLMSDTYFYKDVEADTYEEVIEYMSSKLEEDGRVRDGFLESTLNREKMAYTSFSYGYALPHPLDYLALKSTISVGILKKPVKWGNYQIKFVMLLAVRNEDKGVLKTFFDWFCNICDDSLLLSKILQSETVDEFIDIIME